MPVPGPMEGSKLTARLLAMGTTARGTIVELEGGASISNRDLVRVARADAARWIAQNGDLRGARILASLPPGISWARAFLASVFAGAALVPIPLGAPSPEVVYLATDSGAGFAIVSEQVRTSLPADVVELVLENGAFTTEPAVLPALSDADVALMLYTSGTTGRPKGVPLTHGNLAAQTSALHAAWGLGGEDVLLHALPMHHLHGIVVAFLACFTADSSIRTLPKFDAARVASALKEATVFMAVPTMYQRLVDFAGALDPAAHGDFEAAARALRLTTSGSAALPRTLAERWRALSGAIPLERYGMTEIGMALSNPLAPDARLAGTVGHALPSVETRIVDDQGTDGDGPGELWVRGPSVFFGYHQRDDATREAFVDGWFKTGDVAVRGPTGHVRLLGRTSTDILKTGGEKVSALEIEEVLLEHPSIGEVAVVGMPDPEWGDRVVAVVVLRANHDEDEAGVRAWAKTRLLPYKVPRQVRFVEALPRNAMGKVLKPELVRELGGGSQRGPDDQKTP